MNRVIACLVGVAALAGPIQAQDAALIERVNRLSVYVDELLADKARQQKQITELTREVENLREQLQRTTGGASREDVVAVANGLKQLEAKHRADLELVANQVKKLGSASAPRGRVADPGDYAKGWDYTIEQDNTLSAIAKAFRNNGHKVTVNDILKANPGLDPNKLRVGQVIFIPEL